MALTEWLNTWRNLYPNHLTHPGPNIPSDGVDEIIYPVLFYTYTFTYLDMWTNNSIKAKYIDWHFKSRKTENKRRRKSIKIDVLHKIHLTDESFLCNVVIAAAVLDPKTTTITFKLVVEAYKMNRHQMWPLK